MTAQPTTQAFGLVLARGLQAVITLQMVVQALGAVDRWQANGGPNAVAIGQIAFVALCPVVAVYAETIIVRVGPAAIRWRDARLRLVEVPFGQVEDIRKVQGKDRREVETVDGRTLTLPVRPSTGLEIRRMVLGSGPLTNWPT